MKIGITGATGHLGQIVVAQLKEKTESANIVALVRTPSKATDLGVEARLFDYSKPETLVESLKGIDTLLLISGNEIGQRETQHKNVIQAAKAAGVKKIVYTSLLHADRSSLSLAPEHLATEVALKASGLTYTILRNGWYTENYTDTLAGAIQAGAFVSSAEDGKISAAPRKDYAEAAAVVLASAGHDNKTYELSGDNAFTLTELAAEVSKQTNKEIPYQNIPEAEYAALLIQLGLPEYIAPAIASWETAAAKGDLYDEGTTLSEIIGRPTTPLADTVKATLA